MYLSRDGGLSWSEIQEGLYVYDIADHGGLIVMSKVTSSSTTNVSIIYSWNEGKTWEYSMLSKKRLLLMIYSRNHIQFLKTSFCIW